MTGSFDSSNCRVLWGRAHLVQLNHFTEEERGNLRGTVCKPRSDRKLVPEMILALQERKSC
jgi:hypothetical protein